MRSRRRQARPPPPAVLLAAAAAYLRAAHASQEGFHAAVAASNAHNGSGWMGALCQSRLQSPVDIEPEDVIDSNLQVRLQYGTWKLEDIESVTRQDGPRPTRIRLKPSLDLGYIQVGSSYLDFDEYALSAVEVHTPSEHTFRHASWPVEIQLWHEPISLVRIPALAKRASHLAKRTAKGKGKVERMMEISKQLQQEILGEDAPWEGDRGWKPSRVQELDWIDATKRQVIREARAFQDESTEVLTVAEEIIEDAKRLVQVQKRRYGAHQVVISLLVLRTPFYEETQMAHKFGLPTSDRASVPSGSSLLQWVSGVVAASAGGKTDTETIDVADVLGISNGHLDMYSYHGSLTQPPCTPNVRWLITAQPLPALAKDLEVFLQLIDAGISPLDGVLGGRDIQPLGPSRHLHSAKLLNKEFQRPPLALPEMSSSSALKWAFLQRYGTVFFICGALLLLTPLTFQLARTCQEKINDDADELLEEPIYEFSGGLRGDEFATSEKSSDVHGSPDVRGFGDEDVTSTSWQIHRGFVGAAAASVNAAAILSDEK